MSLKKLDVYEMGEITAWFEFTKWVAQICFRSTPSSADRIYSSIFRLDMIISQDFLEPLRCRLDPLISYRYRTDQMSNPVLLVLISGDRGDR
jgi:hypothetical protein